MVFDCITTYLYQKLFNLFFLWTPYDQIDKSITSFS